MKRKNVSYSIMLLVMIILKDVLMEAQRKKGIAKYRRRIENNKLEGKIIGGKNASISEFPHAVFLFSHCGHAGWLCGSSILNQAIIITAAHCIHICGDSTKISAFAGATYRTQAHCVRDVINYTIHEGYNTKTNEADIALALLDKQLDLGPTIQRVSITPSYPNTQPVVGFVAGWGGISFDGTTPDYLKSVKQTVWSCSNCSKYFTIVKGTFCAYDRPGSQTYKGDSGSALVLKDRKHHMIGLVSYGNKKLPGLVTYMNVSYFYSWITDNAVSLYCADKFQGDFTV